MSVIYEVKLEMEAQQAKWGEQNHVAYTGDGALDTAARACDVDANYAKTVCDRKASDGSISWTDILVEEVFEAIEEGAQKNTDKLREELIQVAAVALSWVESIDRNGF